LLKHNFKNNTWVKKV